MAGSDVGMSGKQNRGPIQVLMGDIGFWMRKGLNEMKTTIFIYIRRSLEPGLFTKFIKGYTLTKEYISGY